MDTFFSIPLSTVIIDGYRLAQEQALRVLDEIAIKVDPGDRGILETLLGSLGIGLAILSLVTLALGVAGGYNPTALGSPPLFYWPSVESRFGCYSSRYTGV